MSKTQSLIDALELAELRKDALGAERARNAIERQIAKEHVTTSSKKLLKAALKDAKPSKRSTKKDAKSAPKSKESSTATVVTTITPEDAERGNLAFDVAFKAAPEGEKRKTAFAARKWARYHGMTVEQAVAKAMGTVAPEPVAEGV